MRLKLPGMQMTTHLRLVARLRLYGAAHSLPHITLWHTQDNLLIFNQCAIISKSSNDVNSGKCHLQHVCSCFCENELSAGAKKMAFFWVMIPVTWKWWGQHILMKGSHIRVILAYISGHHWQKVELCYHRRSVWWVICCSLIGWCRYRTF